MRQVLTDNRSLLPIPRPRRHQAPPNPALPPTRTMAVWRHFTAPRPTSGHTSGSIAATPNDGEEFDRLRHTYDHCESCGGCSRTGWRGLAAELPGPALWGGPGSPKCCPGVASIQAAAPDSTLMATHIV